MAKKHPLIMPGDRHQEVPRAKVLTQRWLRSMGKTLLARRIDPTTNVHGRGSVRGVKGVQKFNNLVVDGIIGPKTWAVLEQKAGYELPMNTRGEWGAKAPSHDPVKVNWGKSTPTRVHHTAVRAPRASVLLFGTRLVEAEKAHMRDLQNFHMNTRGYSDIGYSYVIMPSGRVYEGRGKEVQGAHTLGHNSDVGICFAGNYNTDKLTPAQITSYKVLRRNLGVAAGKAYPHNATYNTGCPGDNVEKQLGF